MNVSELFFLEATQGERYSYQVTDLEGKVLAGGRTDLEIALGKRNGHVVVVWQLERVLSELSGMRLAFRGRRIVDLYHMAWPVVSVTGLADARLESLCVWCGVATPRMDGGKDDVDGRVRAIRECYHMVMNRMALGMKLEGTGRELLTGLAEKAMQAVSKFGG